MSVATFDELLVDELKDFVFGRKADCSRLAEDCEGDHKPRTCARRWRAIWKRPKAKWRGWRKSVRLWAKKLTGKTCAGMKGVLEEGSEVLDETDKGDVRDAALISAAQRVEHYEEDGRVRFGAQFAKLLGAG